MTLKRGSGMAIPDYQSVFLPLLKLIADKKEHSVAEVVETLGDQFKLSSEEKDELLPSGKQPKFYNRVQWAKTYLAQAGLLESTRRSYFQITDRGLKVLQGNPGQINVNYLKQFSEFVEFQSRPSLMKHSPKRQVNQERLAATAADFFNDIGVSRHRVWRGANSNRRTPPRSGEASGHSGWRSQ